MFNYATKFDLKNATGVDTPEFVRKIDLTGLKSDIDKLDINQLETIPADLSKLNNAVEKEVLEKTVYDELVKKVNVIQDTDTSDLV